MARRRQGSREPPFSLDCFVDVITNLVGIVLRLMLVVMMGVLLTGGFSASNREHEDRPEAPGATELEPALADCEAEIAKLQDELLQLTRSCEAQEADDRGLETRADALRAQLATHQSTRAGRLREIDEWIAAQDVVVTAIASAENDAKTVRERLAQLQATIKNLRDQPRAKLALRYHLPVSQPVGPNQLLFEYRSGRVTFADLHVLLGQAREAMPRFVDDLRKRWEVTDTVGPVGAFRLEYTVGRERTSAFDRAFGDAPPVDDHQFSYGLARWELIPVWQERGESTAEALTDGSRFRSIVDGINPNQVALTFFVYEDSFADFRRLRDHLYDGGFVVAGRPLPMDVRIGGSRSGTISRGQ